MKKKYILSIVTSMFLLAWTTQVGAQGVDGNNQGSITELGTVDAVSLEIKNMRSESLEPIHKLDSTLNKLVKAQKEKDQGKVNEIKNSIKTNKAFMSVNEAPAYNINNASSDLVHVYVNLSKGYNSENVKKYVSKIDNYDSNYNLADAWVETDKLEELAAFNGVKSLSLVIAPEVNSGTVESQGDVLQGVDQYRALAGASGKGIKVGVISDGVDSIASAQASLDIGNVTVLRNTYGGDEGTAMLEIVHDLAPDAQLYFHDCGNSFIDFNSAVDSLVDAGCNVVVDDISWLTQPFFEDGIIASHINSVVANKNIVYVSSAGNSQGRHYQKAYSDFPVTSGSSTVHYHDFDKNIAGLQPLPITILNNSYTRLVLEWNDRFGNSSDDYDMYLFNSSGTIVSASESVQNGTQDPVEYLYYQNTTGSDQTYNIYIVKYTGAAKTLELYNYGGSLSSEYRTPQDSIFGHAAAPNVIAVGAIPAADPVEIEEFSSLGPCTITYPSAVIRKKPDVCGIDGVSITGAGGFSNPFYGTSASAPHIAAIAAVLWSQDTTKTAAAVRSKILSSTVDMGATGYDTVYGYGFVNLALLSPPAKPADFKVTVGDKSAAFSWTANTEADLNGYQIDYRKSGAATWTSIAVGKTYTSNKITSLVNGVTYEFRIKAKDTAGYWSLYSDVVTAVPKDNVAPLAPTNFKASTVTDQKVVLTWTAPSAADLAGYNLTYYMEGDSLNTTQVPLGKVLTYAITGLTNDKNYIITINAIDTSGNSSVPASITATPVDNVAPAVPVGLKASLGTKDYSINVSWTANAESDLNGYVLVYQKSGSSLQDSVTLAADAVSAQVENLSPNASYSFKLKAVDKKGNGSALSTAVSAVAKDVTPPSAPAGLGADKADRKVTLSWDQNTEIDLNGYQLEYRKSGITTWTIVSAAKTLTSYTVSSLVNGTTYEFRMKAKDTTGNWSAYTNIITAVPLDNVPPAPPTNFKASTTLTDQKIVLSWSAPSVSDLSGYRLSYAEAGSNTVTEFDLGKVLTYTITGVTNDKSYNLFLCAKDTSGNFSVPALLTASPRDNVAPIVPKGLSAAANTVDYSVNLSWSENLEPDLDYYVVSYQQSGSSVINTENFPAGFIYISISDLTPNAYYNFKVKAVDKSGNASTFCTAVTFKAKDVTPPDAPANFKAAALDRKVTLSWNQNTEPDLNGYQLEYRTVGVSTWKTAAVSKTYTTYTATYLTNGTNYEFRLKAKDVTGNWSSYTDTITCTPGIS